MFDRSFSIAMSSIYGVLSKSGSLIPEDWKRKMEQETGWWQHDGLESVESPGFFMGKALFRTSPTIQNQFSQSHPHFDILADVRLDNIPELKGLLGIDSSSSLSDTDLILKAYDRFGKECVEHLIGAFAFVIYDKRDHSLFLAVDQMGFKPLHYFETNDLFVFGSQKKSVLSIPKVDRSPNWPYIIQKNLRLRQAEDSTEYEFIKRIPSASFMKVDKSKSSETQRYWTLDTTKKTVFKDDQEYIDAFIYHVRRAVADRMRNTREIGTHISGGLDSSGVTGIAASIAKEQGRELHAFSYTVPKEMEEKDIPFENENPYVLDQIRFSKIKHLHRVEKPIWKTARQVVELEASVLDGFSRTNNLNTEYEIQHEAKEQNVDVILSGFPGDELVTSFVRPYYLEYLERGHYFKYFTSKHRGEYSFKKLLGPVLLKLSKAIGGPLNPENAAVLYQRIRSKGMDLDAYKRGEHLFSKEYLDAHPELQRAFEPPLKSQYIYGFPLNLREYQRNHVCRRHTSTRMEHENLAGLQFNVEYRYPYADIRLLQYVLSIPVEQKINKNKTRLIYRRSMTDYMHPSILQRDNKQGSVKPMMTFYRRNTTKTLVEMFNELESSGHLPFIDKEKVQARIDEGYIPANMMMYLMLGELARLGKMSF